MEKEDKARAAHGPLPRWVWGRCTGFVGPPLAQPMTAQRTYNTDYLCLCPIPARTKEIQKPLPFVELPPPQFSQEFLSFSPNFSFFLHFSLLCNNSL